MTRRSSLRVLFSDVLGKMILEILRKLPLACSIEMPDVRIT
jgi:hypothetical protein